MDGTGLRTNRRSTWFAIRLRKYITRREFLKLEGFADVDSQMFASVVITDGYSNEAPLFIRVLEKRPPEMVLGNVAGDKGLPSRENTQYVADQGGRPFLKPKDNVPVTTRPKGCPAWKEEVRICREEPERWKQFYSPRVLIETMWDVLKARFGETLSSKKRWNQKREALLKVACYNALRLGYLLHP